MKRDARIQPLSRDHHEALVLARALRWSTEGHPRAPADPRALLRRAWSDVLASHFHEEEELLVPLVDAAHAERLVRDHGELRDRCTELLQGRGDAAALRAFAAELHDHVRWEERVLFPALEEGATSEQLDALGERLHALEATRSRSA